MAGTLRDRYLAVLLEQLTGCRYPSPTMLDRIEQAIGDRGSAEEYVSELLENVAQDRFPSPQMLDRLSGLLDALEPRAG